MYMCVLYVYINMLLYTHMPVWLLCQVGFVMFVMLWNNITNGITITSGICICYYMSKWDSLLSDEMI